MKKEIIEKKEKVLVVIDMINGFLVEGALADPKMQRVIPENVRLVKKFLNEGHSVVAFRDWHTKDAEEFKVYPVHCLAGTKEAELVDELKVFSNLLKVINKNTTNGFIEREFKEYLNYLINEKEIKEMVVTGVCTDICDLDFITSATKYFKENNLDIDVIVPKNAVDTFDGPGHNREECNENSFKKMEKQGVKLVKKYEGGRR